MMMFFLLIVFGAVLELWQHQCYGGLENNLIEENVDFPSCDSLLKMISFRNVIAPVPVRGADIGGLWVSQSCETRPGSYHVIRSYTFGPDDRFSLTLHHYFDPFCAKPKLSAIAGGRIALKRGSLVTPGGTEADYYLESFAIVLHSPKATFELSAELNKSCPTTFLNNVQLQKRFVLFEAPESLNEIDTSSTSCIPTVFQTWNELQLLRLEILGDATGSRRCPAKEFFLGDLHSNPKKQNGYRPTSYQTPLLHSECIEECDICQRVVGSSAESPPAIVRDHRIRLPTLLRGTWASRRCEVQRHGLFLTRKLSFKPNRPKWSISQKYFDDPRCRNATYTILASGKYQKVAHSHHLDGDAFDMIIRRMNIVPESRSFVVQLNRIPPGLCGTPGLWRMKKGQDVSATGGCSPIGLRVPSREPEIFRLQTGKRGEVLLTLGQTPTGTHTGLSQPHRPTSWGPPLQKCSPTQESSNQLQPVVGAIVASAGEGRHSGTGTVSLLLTCTLSLFWQRTFGHHQPDSSKF